MARITKWVILAALLAGPALLGGQPAAFAADHDGNWSVLVVTESGTCDRGYRYNVRIAGGILLWPQESQMPKLKTKSGAKKRFKVTATGKVMHAQRGKRHGMIKRTKKQIRQLRGTRVLFKTDGDNVKKYFLPNA